MERLALSPPTLAVAVVVSPPRPGKAGAATLPAAPLACRALLVLDALVFLVPSTVALPILVLWEGAQVAWGALFFTVEGRPAVAFALAMLMLVDLVGLWTMMAQEVGGRPPSPDRSGVEESVSHVGAAVAVVLCLFPSLDPLTYAPPLLVPYVHLLLHRRWNARRHARTLAEGFLPPRGVPGRSQSRPGERTAQARVAANDFEARVGRAGWRRLRGRIRERFTARPGPGRDIHYRGVMEKVECNGPGWMLAQLGRLIGTPFALHRGRDVPTRIRLSDDGEGGVVWHREYAFEGRAPVHVRSTKRGGPDGSLLECVGMGLGMRLAVFEANGDLHFLSLGYFLRIGGRLLTLPGWLSPGTAHVIHRDLGGTRFRFTMTIHHPWFGTLFHQDGVFHDAHDAHAGDAS